MTALPCRMGTHHALDAAVLTLLEVHQDICTFSTRTDENLLLQHYNRAIRALRLRLADPTAIYEPETLCAIMILSACSPRFAGPGVVFVNPHARAAAEILKIQGFPCGRNDFETTLYAMLRNAVAIKAIVDPEIGFSDEDWTAFEGSYQGDQPVTRLMRCAVRIGRLMAHARSAISDSVKRHASYQEATEVQYELDRITLDLKTKVYASKPHTADPILAARNHAQHQRSYCQALGISAQLLCIRRALSPAHSTFDDELDVLSSRMLQLAEDTRAYRPLGANWTVIALMTVWCATQGTRFQSGIEEVLDGWREDTLGQRSTMPRDVLYNLHSCLSLGHGQYIAKSRPVLASPASHLILVPAKTSTY